MGNITSIRPLLPVSETPVASAVEARAPGRSPGDGAAPVAQTIQAQAVRQTSGPAASAAPQLMQARMTADSTATAAAEAARDAYIRASIAAGLSPLPLP